MRSKDEDGHWSRRFDQYEWGGPYTESGPWQSSWGVQHDVLGLADLVGGPAAFGAKLDDLFTHPPIFKTGYYNGVIHEMIEFAAVGMGQYGACNQPSFHLPYLYAAIGQPWKTEYWTRRACRELFNATPAGFSGDDDNGSNSSWYLLSAMGIYSLTPGHPSYVLTSPEFDSVKIALRNGKTLEIVDEEQLGEKCVRRLSHRERKTVDEHMDFARGLGKWSENRGLDVESPQRPHGEAARVALLRQNGTGGRNV